MADDKRKGIRTRAKNSGSDLELAEQRARFFSLSRDLLATSDVNGNFGQLNPTWTKVAGFKEEELKSQPWTGLIHADDQAETFSHLSALQKKDSTAYFEGRFRCKNGSYRWLAWTIASFVEEGLLYISARDITEFHPG